MSERYTKLFSLPENLYEKDCPVMICAGVLSKDTQTNKVFVQLRLQNVDNLHRTIVAVKVGLQPFGIAHNSLGNIKEYQYLDINAERGAEAGSKQPVYLDDNTARSFSAFVLEVVFEDGSVWTGSTQNWCSLQQTKLSDKFNTDLMEQYQRDTFTEAKYEPFNKDGIWMCACGALNTIEDSKCCRCHNDKVKQLAALDHSTLASHLQEYADKKQATLKQIEADVQAKKKKTTKFFAIALVLVCIFVGILAAWPSISLHMESRPIVDQLVGTTWSTEDVEITFVDKNTVFYKAKGIEDDVSFKVIGIEHRSYTYHIGGFFGEQKSAYGDAMTISIMYPGNYVGAKTTEVDVFLKTIGEKPVVSFLIFDPPIGERIYTDAELMSSGKFIPAGGVEGGN